MYCPLSGKRLEFCCCSPVVLCQRKLRRMELFAEKVYNVLYGGVTMDLDWSRYEQ